MYFKSVKDFFSFPVTQQKGIIFVLLIVVSLFSIRIWLQFTRPVFAADTVYLDSLVNTLSRDTGTENVRHTEAEQLNMKTSCNPLNVNSAAKEDFIALGLPEYLAERVVKYRTKAGAFKGIEALQRIYGMNAQLYERIKPCLYTTGTSEEELHSVHKAEKIDLNTADSTALTALRGIGPVLASRIIKYRKALGGFTEKEQLAEIYGMSSETYTTLEEQIRIHPESVTKLDIQRLTLRELRKHPYLRWKPIQDYLYKSKKSGTIIREADLQALLSDTAYRKLLPYLNFETP